MCYVYCVRLLYVQVAGTCSVDCVLVLHIYNVYSSDMRLDKYDLFGHVVSVEKVRLRSILEFFAFIVHEKKTNSKIMNIWKSQLKLEIVKQLMSKIQ